MAYSNILYRSVNFYSSPNVDFKVLQMNYLKIRKMA